MSSLKYGAQFWVGQQTCQASSFFVALGFFVGCWPLMEADGSERESARGGCDEAVAAVGVFFCLSLTSPLSLSQIKDFTRPTMWPFVVGFGVVNFLAFKYLKFPDGPAGSPERKASGYATQIDNWGKPAEHGHAHGKH